ncbi:MAG: hypothetical protein ACD_28C00418G0005 [uncultured bacterium]|nr:MAG: hypothetical protein ACD_28C00418G0005 [uncultured bacterium]
MNHFIHSAYELGRTAESLSAHYLQACDYRILATRFRIQKGEVDLVAQQKSCLVFVEVKARASPLCGSGMEAIDSFKVLKLSRVAEAYVQQFSWNGDVRIDAIELEFSGQHDLIHFRHLIDVTF